MNDISLIFSLLFFSLILIYLYFGIYIIRLDKTASINKVFLSICVSVSIWSFGFGMANLSQNIDDVLFWRRVSALGWTSIYSFMLHFTILLSYKYIKKKKLLVYSFLYIPAIINMYIFSFSNKIASLQYNIIKIEYGWINKSLNNGWDWFFRFYYVSFVVLSIFFIWKWQNDLKDKKTVRHARVIVGGLLFGLILGTITDIVVSSIGLGPFPQMAPVFIMLPAWAMYYSARYHGAINQGEKLKRELIATEKDKKKMFYYIATVFFIGGMINFSFEYSQYLRIEDYNLKLGIVKSLMFFVTGSIVFSLQHIKQKSIRELLTIIVLVSNIPIVTLHFLKFAGITIWTFPMIIIIASLVFSKRQLLISATIVFILTQILIWILRPELVVTVNHYDYILRIVLIVAAFLVGSYVNMVYVAKIKENEYQIKFKNMTSIVSSDFVSLTQENSDIKMKNLLLELGNFFVADRAYIFSFNRKNDTMTYLHEWCRESINKRIYSNSKIIEEISIDKYSWWINQLRLNKNVYIKDVSKIPNEGINERTALISQDVKSIISVPIEGSDGIQGFICIESVESIKNWTNEDIEILNITSNLIADALNKLKSEKEINFMAYYDNLTKLPNRFLFIDRVNQAIHLSKRLESFISIIFLDLDNFKSVNDTIGHKGGDYLLEEVARKLEHVVRKTDTVSRFGGDEFMIMLNNVNDHKDITNIADKIMEIFQKPFSIDGQEFNVTASAGISIHPVDGLSAEELIKNADNAMYNAKNKGKNQYALCTLDMKEEVQLSMTLSNDLYRALERDELVVYYQPQINLSDGVINGLEALVRWKHPERGMISPGIFIPIAEKNGTINNIGEWVLKTACLQNKKWQDMGLPHLLMAVNLSAIQFINPRIAENIADILDETGLSPKYLELEITESIAIKEVSHAEEILSKLKDIGISIAIDDFGTEYSSLSRLKMLPIDRIKIDMQFTQGIESNEKDRAITMVIINLAKSLGLSVLAEGVETAPQMDFLNKKMCDDVQGFYYYRPMPAEEVEKILFKIYKENLI